MGTRSDGALTDGVWLLSNGEGLYLDESKSKNPDDLPYIALSSVLQNLIQRAAEGEIEPSVFNAEGIQDWLNTTPPPSGGGRAIQKWYEQLANFSIRRGLTLIWRAEIMTAVQEESELAKIIQNGAETVQRLEWSPDERVLVTYLHSRTESSVDSVPVGRLTGAFPSTELEQETEENQPNSFLPQPNAPADVLSAMQQLKAMLDQGLITQDEFGAKKVEILARL